MENNSTTVAGVGKPVRWSADEKISERVAEPVTEETSEAVDEKINEVRLNSNIIHSTSIVLKAWKKAMISFQSILSSMIK